MIEVVRRYYYSLELLSNIILSKDFYQIFN